MAWQKVRMKGRVSRKLLLSRPGIGEGGPAAGGSRFVFTPGGCLNATESVLVQMHLNISPEGFRLLSPPLWVVQIVQTQLHPAQVELVENPFCTDYGVITHGLTRKWQWPATPQ